MVQSGLSGYSMAASKTPKNMRLFGASVDSPDLREMIAAISTVTTDQVHAVLEFVRKDVLYFLKSYTDVLVPPVGYQRKFGFDANLKRVAVPSTDRTGWRPAHPGGWGDVTGDLKAKYKTDLQFVDNAWQLTIRNDSEHAVYVEAMHGMFVVHGVLEPNGPVATSIKRALSALNVPWKVQGSAITSNSATLDIGPRSGTAPAPSGDVL